MNQIRLSVAIFARVLIVAVFLANGFGIVDQTVAMHEMIARGIPANLAPLMALAGRAIEIVAGLGLVFGQYRRLCAVALILFLIPATLIAHSFWIAPSQLFQVQLVNFLKNLSMIGGLLLIASLSSETHMTPDRNQLRSVVTNTPITSCR
jgi:putative oxidoreductase